MCGVTTSRQGLRLVAAALSMAVPALLRFSRSHLLVEAQAQKLHLHLLDFVRLRRRDGGEKPPCRIERAVGVVAGE